MHDGVTAGEALGRRAAGRRRGLEHGGGHVIVALEGGGSVQAARRDGAVRGAPGHGDRNAVAGLGPAIGTELLSYRGFERDGIGNGNDLRYGVARQGRTSNPSSILQLARGKDRGRRRDERRLHEGQALRQLERERHRSYSCM